MEKLQEKYRSSSTRADWWDYSANGRYFITICTAKHECIFGTITNDIMHLSTIGQIVLNDWNASFEIRKELFCDAFVIMPNHIHAVLWINNQDNEQLSNFNSSSTDTTILRMPKSISSFIAGFKSSVTRCIKQRAYMPNGRDSIWQPRYYDRIIRNDDEYHRIVNYINNNPFKWMDDKYYSLL